MTMTIEQQKEQLKAELTTLARMEAGHADLSKKTNLTSAEEESSFKARVKDSEEKMRTQRKRIRDLEQSIAGK
jgi:hypothetical protein